MRRALPTLLLLALLPACAPSRTSARTARALPAAPAGRVRLGWITWPDPDVAIYCNRRVDDNGGTVGVLGPCWRMEAGGQSRKIMSWTNLGRQDASSTSKGPFDRCSIELEDAVLVGAPRPARAWLMSSTAKTQIDEWAPDPKLPGDAFAVELSFSPEGKWMAVLHLSVGLGEGERTVEIAGASLLAPPACK